MIIGFTGTRRGMTHEQRSIVMTLLKKAKEAHHGDCIGADEQFHDLCRILSVPVVVHPPEDERLRAFCPNPARIEPPRPYLVRDRIIVDRCDLLIATPKEGYEPAPQRGQGTWSTVRYARRSGQRFRVVWPEGMKWAP